MSQGWTGGTDWASGLGTTLSEICRITTGIAGMNYECEYNLRCFFDQLSGRAILGCV